MKSLVIFTVIREIIMIHIDEWIEKHIDYEAVVISDASKFYTGIEEIFSQHHVINHLIESKNLEGYNTNLIESTWRTIRKDLGVGYKFRAAFGFFINVIF